MHLESNGVGETLPSIEGVLVRKWGREYVLGVPQLLVAPGENPAVLESRWVRIPRERVAFYEVLT